MNNPMTRSTKLSRTRGADHVEQPPVPKAKRTRGRPSDYDEDKLRQAVLIAKLGGTDAEIAEATGVSVTTVYNWYNQFPEFLEAVRAAKDMQNHNVARSLFQRARGYSYKSEKVFSNGMRAEVYEHVPADVGAALNWLYNRDPERWKKTGEMQIIVPVDENTDAPDVRQLALQGLALFNAAVYDQDEQPQGLVIEGHAREENDDGETSADTGDYREGSSEPYDPDFDEPDGARDAGDFDLDPGEI